MEEEENEKKDWRDILNKLNQQIKQVDELPKEPKKTEEERERKEIHSKDFVDIKLEYRRIKIQEQCKKLNSRVVLPSRSSWRDRIAAAGTSSSSTNQPQSVSSTCKPTSPECQRRTNLNWGQRRTKVYHIDSEIDVHKFKIIDTIHIKRSQIEARLAEYQDGNNNKRKSEGEGTEVLMLTYPGYEKLHVNKRSEVTDKEAEEVADTESTEIVSDEPFPEDQDDILKDPNLDGLALKDNTKKKLSQFTQHLIDAEKAKIKSPPLPKKKNYTASVDWREELKNRDRARQLQELKGFKIGTPDYKEPEKEKEDPPPPKVEDNRWGKSKAKWERLKLKPALKSQEKSKDNSELRADDPFKINLKPVTDRKKAKENQTQSPVASNNRRKNGQKLFFNNKVDNRDTREFEKLSQSPTIKLRQKLRNNFVKEEEEVKPSKNKDLARNTTFNNKKEENKKQTEKKNKPVQKTRVEQGVTSETDDKKYVIKVINFVAIKVALDSTPTQRRRAPEKKRSLEKPPIPSEKPPSLPVEEDMPEISVAQECELEDINQEIVNILNTDFDERLKNEIFDDLMVEIIKENPEFRTARSRREIVQTCPKPKPKSVYKMKNEQSFDEKYFKPRRKKILDYVPESLPKLNKREDIKIQPMKFSSVSENCVTKSLFVGSQYIGNTK